MSAPTVVFATCLAMPDMQPDDAPLADALRADGVDVATAPWNGPFEPFAAAEVVAVRSPWDYAEAPHDFLRWLQRLEDHGAVTGNSCALMRWNARKSYLLELAERGAPLLPTIAVRADAREVANALAALDVDEAVVKPQFGAGASGLTIAQRGDDASCAQAAARLGGDGIVQPLITEIAARGETSLTFFAGEFSHAVVKRPAAGSILVQAEHGGSVEAAVPAAEVVQTARDVLSLLPEEPLYARVDLVLAAAGPILMEVELIEPELFLRFDARAATRFAAVLNPVRLRRFLNNRPRAGDC